MLKHLKKEPALGDLDPMPFGLYKGKPMQDVPPSYLSLLKDQGVQNQLVANYIHNSWDAIQMELKNK
jgi:hypothetical protein